MLIVLSFFVFFNLFILLLQFCVLLCLLPTSGNCFTNKARLGLFLSLSIAFIFLLNWIHLFVLELIEASSGGLVYARWDTLDMKILWLQVYWGWSKLFVYINCLLLIGRVFLNLIIRQHLDWFNQNLLQYWSSIPVSGQEFLSLSSSARSWADLHCQSIFWCPHCKKQSDWILVLVIVRVVAA